MIDQIIFLTHLCTLETTRNLSLVFFMMFLFFTVFSIIHEYENKFIYVSDHRKKCLYLSFDLKPSLVSYDKKHSRYI